MKWIDAVDADLSRLTRFFLPHKGRLAIASFFLLGSASMSSITATLLGKITDAGFYNQEDWVIYGAPLALIGVTLSFAFCTVMSTYLMAPRNPSNHDVRTDSSLARSCLSRTCDWPNLLEIRQ